ncbi:MAG: hypothetical protein C4563_03930 [Desulfobulbus sp.]|jgi:photosystem II stability/assembly factor-like uncharacterized protein|nr:MAG: hypothetical protein C4563_03930 [Desulfobulbus sp.]
MKPRIPAKQFCIGSLLLVFFLLAGDAAGAFEPVYAGWAAGGAWNGYGTVLRSIDSGKTWVRQGAGQIGNINLNGVFAVDTDTGWLVGAAEGGYASIYHTGDGGATWQRKGSADPGAADYLPNVELSKVHAAGIHVWAVGSGGTILHSDDGGQTWTNRYPAWYGTVYLQGVYALDNKTVWVTGDIKDGYATILKTTDGGQTWTRQSGGDVGETPYLLGISAADSDTAWAVGHYFIVLKTTDGGKTWTKDPNFGGEGDANEVYAVNPSTVWVATDNEVVWSTDGGLTWNHSSAHGLSGAIAFMGISAVSDRQAWTSFNFSDQFIAATDDGGATWTKIEQLNGEELPDMNNISFATRPLNPFPWHLVVPALTGK